ncbi:MAG: CPBP family intramembrane metalloprotease [Myxococcales bacterium]|nr:CPBP family intramembrane metalloprotease [Myxococcales bacterium]
MAVLTAVVHVLPLERWYPELAEIVVLAGGWLGYLGYLAARDRQRLAEMGFRREGALGATIFALGVLASGTLVMGAYGVAAGTLRMHPQHMAILATLYPIWGWVQQWLVLGIFARQLRRSLSAPLVVVLTAAMFGALHLPDVTLAAGTLTLGLLLTPIYLRYGNLWPLGVAHGWLAIPMYFWVRGVDPWSEVTAAAG